MSDRFAREFLELRMNADERQRRLFDGLLISIAGAGKTFTNFAFGQPGRTRSQHADHDFPENWPPFGYAGGDAADPCVFAVNSSSEYWQKGASLVHAQPDGSADLALPPNVRAYLIAGTQHAALPSQQTGTGPCVWPRNPQRVGPVLRAMLTALDAWVAGGTEPPASAVPAIADRTLVPPAQLTFPPIGPHPPAEANPVEPFTVLVPAVDADGNEIAGIRMPDVAVPLGTYTGWNYFNSPLAPNELCNHAGTYVPFAPASLRERYGTPAQYVRQVRRCCDELIRERYLLAEDAAGYVERAEAVVL